MSRSKSHTPASDHPWLNRGKTYGPGLLASPRRTISDELRDTELSRLQVKEGFGNDRRSSDEDVRRSRDPSYSGLSEGAGMRRPVRYD